MPISSPFVLQQGDTLWDLRKVSSWSQTNPDPTNPTVQVRFIDNPSNTVEFPQGAFETAMQLALNAAT